MQKVCLTWVPTMFSFGFYRQWRTEHKLPLLNTERAVWSTVNGIFYVVPPYGLANIAFLLDRLEIEHTNKNKMDYRCSYGEMRGYNYNTF